MIKIFLILLIFCNNSFAAVDFDGTGDTLTESSFVQIGQHRSSFWIKPDADAGTIYSNSGTGSVYMTTTNTIGLNKGYSTTSLVVECANNSITLGSWTNIIIDFQSSATASQYDIIVNGRSCTKKTTTNGVGIPSIGSTPNAIILGSGYDGKISNFYLWDGISDSTGALNGASNTGRTYRLLMSLGTSLTNYWPLDDCDPGDTGCVTYKDIIGKEDLTAAGNAVASREELINYP